MNEVKRTLVVGGGNADFGDDSIGPRNTLINHPDTVCIEMNYAGMVFFNLPAKYNKSNINNVFNSPYGQVVGTYCVHRSEKQLEHL